MKKFDASYKPGVVVFAQLKGYPWWPAIVGRCHIDGMWKDKQGRVWVYFVNENQGAWMKLKNVQAYSPETQTTLQKNMLREYRNQASDIKDAYYLASQYIAVRKAGWVADIPWVFNEILTAEAVRTQPATCPPLRTLHPPMPSPQASQNGNNNDGNKKQNIEEKRELFYHHRLLWHNNAV